MRTALVALVLVIGLMARPGHAQDGGDPAAAPATPLALAELVGGVEAFYGGQQNFSARFEQVVVRSHLPDRPATKSGQLFFKRPGMMRWDYEKPDRVFYVSDGKTFWNYVPESKLAYRLKVEDSELFYALRFLWGEGSLARDFDLADGGRDGDLRVVVVKPKAAEHNFQELKLFVASDFAISRTEIIDPAGNLSRVSFLKVSYKELPEKGFRFEPPADVQVEDLSGGADPAP